MKCQRKQTFYAFDDEVVIFVYSTLAAAHVVATQASTAELNEHNIIQYLIAQQ